MSIEEGWAQLVSMTDVETPPIPLIKNKNTIGRARDCDISLDDNKLVSGRHCFVERDENGKVWLFDTSTNGTLLNLSSRISKGNRKELHHGDEFYIVYKKNNMELNVGYMYQDMEELRKEEILQTQENSSDDDHMLDATVVDSDINIIAESPDKKRRHQEADISSSSEPLGKKQKKQKCDSSDSTQAAHQKVGDKIQTSDMTSSINKKHEDIENAKEKNVGDLSCSEKRQPQKDSKDKGECPKDEIEETLICIICQEIMHDCISLQPCMHSFCAGCYSGWMERSTECPSCRLKVERINKNHIVNNLIEAYLKEHPAKRRGEEEIKELDAKNKITRDMLYPSKKHHGSDSDLSSEDYGDSDDEPPVITAAVFTPTAPFLAPTPVTFGFGTPLFGIRPRTVCRSCPGYVEPPTVTPATPGVIGGITTAAIQIVKNILGASTDNTTQTTTAGGTGGATNTGETTGTSGPSTSGGSGDGQTRDPDEKVMPTPPQFTCTLNQNHVLCVCCFQSMPDRRYEYSQNAQNIPPQQCTVCLRSFCHAYWGCLKADCTGCLAKFQDLNFTKKCLPNLILDNLHESSIFKNYLEDKGLSVNDILTTCLERLDNGGYSCSDQARFNITPCSVICYSCGLRNFKELAYRYRRDIANDQLPAEVTARPDCYWGKNCRTQRNKPHHAINFNHICEQIRTA